MRLRALESLVVVGPTSADLMRELEEIKRSLVEEFEPRAEELLEERIEEIDDRPDFPAKWLGDQIVMGSQYLGTGAFTDPAGISRRLKEMMKNV